MPIAFALAAAAALGQARLAGDAEDEHDRDEERGGVDDEDRPDLAGDRGDDAGDRRRR